MSGGSSQRFISIHLLLNNEEMDEIDRRLIILLCESARMPVRELSDRLGLSRQAVQKRLLVLKSIGVFKNACACISPYYLNAIPVMVFGHSSGETPKEVLDGLGESELTRHAIACGGEHYYVTGMLRNTSELHYYVRFVTKAARLTDPTVGMFSLHDGIMPDGVDGVRKKESYRALAPIDLKIIDSLRGDIRRPLGEIADTLGVSTRTVNRHLEIMISEGILDFDLPVDISSGADVYSIVEVYLRKNADNVEVGRRLLSIFPLHTLWIRSFSNLPAFLLCTISGSKMAEIRIVLNGIDQDESVAGVAPNVLCFERQYESWRERLPTAVASFAGK